MTQTAFFRPPHLYNRNMRASAEDEIVSIHFSVLRPKPTTNLWKCVKNWTQGRLFYCNWIYMKTAETLGVIFPAVLRLIMRAVHTVRHCTRMLDKYNKMTKAKCTGWIILCRDWFWTAVHFFFHLRSWFHLQQVPSLVFGTYPTAYLPWVFKGISFFSSS